MTTTINTGDIGDRIGVKIPTTFITDTLGVEPVGKDKRASLFTEDQFVEICEKLKAHLDECIDGNYVKKPLRNPKSAPAAASDDDEL